MMSEPGKRDDEQRKNDDLSPALQAAVERIRIASPPEELCRQSIDRLRTLDPEKSVRRSAVVAWRRRVVPFALAVAACLLGLLLALQFRNDGSREPSVAEEESPASTLFPRTAHAAPEVALNLPEQPTLWNYHGAARSSPEVLTALLDRHASQSEFSGSESLRLGIPNLFQEAI